MEADHYILVPEVDPFSTAHAVFIPVADVDKVHKHFVDKGVPLVASSEEGALADLRRRWQLGESIARITEVEDKPWGVREFALLDPTNNLLRFGHPSEN